jgi:hypothetical protein
MTNARSLLVVASLTVTTSCKEKADEPVLPEAPAATPAATTRGPVAAEDHYGKPIRLGGEVDGVLGPNQFELEGDGVLFAEEVLVISRTPIRFGTMALTDDDEVIVEGTVQKLVVADVERDFELDFTPEIETEHGDRPIIVASSIRRIGTAGEWREDQIAAPPAEPTAPATPADPEIPGTTDETPPEPKPPY